MRHAALPVLPWCHLWYHQEVAVVKALTHQLECCLYTVYLSLVFGSCSRSYLTSVGFWVVQSVSERFSVNFVTGINRPYIGMYYKRGMYCSIANQCIGELVSLSETKIVPAALSIAVRRTFRGPPGTMQ